MSFKKLIVASAAAIAMGAMSSAHASGTILFDPDGVGGAAPISVDVFDWSPGNALNIGALSTLPGLGGAINTRVVAQGALGIFQGPSGNSLPIGQITFQADFFESATGVGSANANFTLGTGASAFRIYWNPTVVNNSTTGLGYDAGTLIMSGTLVSLTGTFADSSVASGSLCATAGGLNCGLLDAFGGDQQSGTRTHIGNGSTTVEVDVTYADPTFFLSNVTSLMVDLQDTTNNAIPFNTVNPSDVVLGVTPVYSLAGGSRVNGAGCISINPNTGLPVIADGQTEAGVTVAGRCDIHLLTDASTSFNPTDVPEPGTLAIAGLALGLLGLSSRRRKA